MITSISAADAPATDVSSATSGAATGGLKRANTVGSMIRAPAPRHTIAATVTAEEKKKKPPKSGQLSADDIMLHRRSVGPPPKKGAATAAVTPGGKPFALDFRNQAARPPRTASNISSPVSPPSIARSTANSSPSTATRSSRPRRADPRVLTAIKSGPESGEFLRRRPTAPGRGLSNPWLLAVLAATAAAAAASLSSGALSRLGGRTKNMRSVRRSNRVRIPVGRLRSDGAFPQLAIRRHRFASLHRRTGRLVGHYGSGRHHSPADEHPGRTGLDMSSPATSSNPVSVEPSPVMPQSTPMRRAEAASPATKRRTWWGGTKPLAPLSAASPTRSSQTLVRKPTRTKAAARTAPTNSAAASPASTSSARTVVPASATTPAAKLSTSTDGSVAPTPAASPRPARFRALSDAVSVLESDGEDDDDEGILAPQRSARSRLAAVRDRRFVRRPGVEGGDNRDDREEADEGDDDDDDYDGDENGGEENGPRDSPLAAAARAAAVKASVGPGSRAWAALLFSGPDQYEAPTGADSAPSEGADNAENDAEREEIARVASLVARIPRPYETPSFFGDTSPRASAPAASGAAASTPPLPSSPPPPDNRAGAISPSDVAAFTAAIPRPADMPADFADDFFALGRAASAAAVAAPSPAPATAAAGIAAASPLPPDAAAALAAILARVPKPSEDTDELGEDYGDAAAAANAAAAAAANASLLAPRPDPEPQPVPGAGGEAPPDGGDAATDADADADVDADADATQAAESDAGNSGTGKPRDTRSVEGSGVLPRQGGLFKKWRARRAAAKE
ncbi:hypothetical protein HK405_011701 [Cladochytrium tenue]|nr:hypothetical protein HK405_011701 [Cladochytrium tenue]